MKQAVDVITSLLEAHGQGGPCCDDAKYSTYAHHNSFLIADKSEAWVVETADREWAAESVTGVFLIDSPVNLYIFILFQRLLVTIVNSVFCFAKC